MGTKRLNTAGCVGERYGMLTVLESNFKLYGNLMQTIFTCKCACGNVKEFPASNIIRGKIISCGCFRKRQLLTHGGSYTRIYSTWNNMKSRCYSKGSKNYHNYGGRGITVCAEWRKNFENFKEWALENGYSDNLSIDRINVDGNYEPENCRWATDFEQRINRRPPKSRTGIVGVAPFKGKYQVRITINHKNVHIGTFKTIENAIEARLQAEKQWYNTANM